MSLIRNTQCLLGIEPPKDFPRQRIEYNFLSYREIYDGRFLTADRYSSDAARWALHGESGFYVAKVISYPRYRIPQELCLSFDCFQQASHNEKLGVHASWFPSEPIAFEFLVLLSLFAREALIPLGLRREDDEPTTGTPHKIFPRRELQAKPPEPFALNGNEFVAVLHGLAKARSELSQATIAAAKFYHSALMLRDYDISVAYVAFVSAIETLAGAHFADQKYDFDAVSSFEKPAATLNKIAGIPGAGELVDVLKKQLLDREYFSRKRFVLFLQEFVTEEFWQVEDHLFPNIKSQPAISSQNFEQCVKAIYDARSKYVHGGTPYPDYVEFGLRSRHPTHLFEELLDLRDRSRFVPFLAWFERLCHTTITEFMRRVIAPELGKAAGERENEKQEILAAMAALPPNAQASLRNLVRWTSQFLGAALVGPKARNSDWADSAETIALLQERGIIRTDGAQLDGLAWLADRTIGEIAGEFVFGAAKNPFRGNEILPPKGYS